MNISSQSLFRTILAASLVAGCMAAPVQAQAPAAAAAPAAEAPAPAPPTETADAAAETEAPPADEPTDEPTPSENRRGANVNSAVAVGDDSTLGVDERANAVVAIFGSSTSDGTVDQAVVSVFGDTRVTGSVGNAVVAVFGDAYVNNHVGDAVVAVLGNVELGPEANVGEVVVIGGSLSREEGAVVRGGVQRILTSEFRGLRFLRPWTRHALLLGRPLALEPGLGWAWGLAFGFLALYVGLAALFRDGVDRCVQTLETRPGHAVLAAILTTLLTPVLLVALLISVLGIAAVPFVILGLIAASLFGKAVVLAWIGKRCTRFAESGPLTHTAMAVFIGGIVVLGLYLVPFIGLVVFNAIGVLGLGVVIYTLLLSVQSSRGARAAAAPASGPAPAAAPFAAPVDAPFAAHSDAPAAADAPASAAGGASAGFAQATPPADAAPPPGRKPEPQLSDAETAALPRATFWIRMAALAIDAVMIGILVGMLNQDGDLWLLLLAGYGAVMWKLRGTTIGGVVFGLKVVRRDGRPVDWATAIVRALSCFLSAFVAGLGFIWIIFDDEKQAWHDKIAGTVVVTVPKGVSLL